MRHFHWSVMESIWPLPQMQELILNNDPVKIADSRPLIHCAILDGKSGVNYDQMYALNTLTDHMLTRITHSHGSHAHAGLNACSPHSHQSHAHKDHTLIRITRTCRIKCMLSALSPITCSQGSHAHKDHTHRNKCMLSALSPITCSQRSHAHKDHTHRIKCMLSALSPITCSQRSHAHTDHTHMQD